MQAESLRAFRLVRVLVPILLPFTSLWAQAVSYPDFSSSGNLALAGTAAITTTQDGQVLRLVPAKCCAAGSAFTGSPIAFQNGAYTFSTFFQFRLTTPGGADPADGIVFVIRTKGSPVLGAIGGAEGYDGIANSLGIKLDTYRNGGEINDNHVAVQTNGVWLDEFAQSPYGVTKCESPAGVSGCMSNGDLWSVWIDYDGLNLHVAVADNSNIRPADLITAPLSVPMILNNSESAYVGFTAATGSGWENHDIINWQYFSTYNPTPTGFTQQLPAKQ